MDRLLLRTAAAVACGLSLLVASSGKPADPGLTGHDRLASITIDNIEYDLTITHFDRAEISMHYPTDKNLRKAVDAPKGSFKKTAIALADFRQKNHRIQSYCSGGSHDEPMRVEWRYMSGATGSYSAMRRCKLPFEKHFLAEASKIPERVGLQYFIDQNPTGPLFYF
jgi:hypothetical protein